MTAITPDQETANAAPFSDAAPFQVELEFTETYRRHEGDPACVREARCLGAMFPAALARIEPGLDLLAGRFVATRGVAKVRHGWDPRQHNMPAIGFLPLRPGDGASAGYYCAEDVLRHKMEVLQPDAETREALEEALRFWKDRTLPEKTRAACPHDLAQALPFDNIAGRPNANPGHPLVRMTGPMLNWRKLVDLGIPGLREAIDKSAADTANAHAGFHEGMLIALDILADTCRFYAKQARKLAAEQVDNGIEQDLQHLAKCLERLPVAPPATLREAMQLVLLFGVISGAYSWGRMDDYLGDFLAADLKAGRLDEEGAIRLITSLWRIIDDNGAPFDNRVIIGGAGRVHPENADRFARLAMEASRRTTLPLPQLSLRFHPNDENGLYEQALEILGEGCTFPILYNDAVNIPAVMHAMNVTEDQARQYAPYGCGEYVLCGQSFGTPSGIFNHTKVLECLIRNGEEKLTGRRVGPQLGHLREFATFDELFDAYCRALDYWTGLLADQQKIEYDVVGRECGYVFWSMLYEDCLERGLPMFSGGLRHLGGTLESYGQINAGDSLLAIKKAVFDEKRVSADELIEALDTNFADREDLRRVLDAYPKYGNDDPEADEMAVRVHEYTCRKTREQASRVGVDSYLIVIINNMCNTVLGEHTLASADGRGAFQPLANANNPAPGKDRQGTTAFLNSLVKLRPDLHAGAVQNMKFSRHMFTESLPKLQTLLRVYFRKGAQAMLTVINPGELEDALRHPEKYPNLMVRVGGFSARFVELPRAVQQEVVTRSLNT